jgi:hypothetical protein
MRLQRSIQGFTISTGYSSLRGSLIAMAEWADIPLGRLTL